MKAKVKSNKTIQLDERISKGIGLEIEFVFKNHYVKSISEDKLIIYSYTEIENYDSVFEVNRYNRSNYIAILNIISYFTNYPLTVNNFTEGKDEIAKTEDDKWEVEKIRLYADGVDYSQDLEKLLTFLNSEFETVLTVLDRWRKAIYMEAESDNAIGNLYHDEAILIHFGILELLAGKYVDVFKKEIEDDVKAFLDSFYRKNFHLSNGQINEKRNIKYKMLKQLLIEEEANINNHLLFMLDKLGIYNEQVKFLVKDLIKCRNQIAHGNISYQEKFIWPLPPFYYLTSDSKTILNVIREFSRLVIAKYIGLERIHEIELFDNLLPSKSIIKDFLRNPGKYKLDTNQLIDGNECNINLETLFYYYVHKRNIQLSKLVMSVKEPFLAIALLEKNGPILLNFSILLADSEDETISKKAIENIQVIVKNDWHYWSNIKDALRYLKFFKVDVVWFETWIENSGYIKDRL